MIPAPFRYVRPSTVTQALELLRDEPGACVLAGGQSLLTQLKSRAVTPDLVVDLGALAELREVRSGSDVVTIGAMVTFATLARLQTVREALPLLAQTVAHIADVQVRNRGTIGGSLAYADPSGDLAGAVIAAGGTVRLVSADGERELPAEQLYSGPFSTVLARDELLLDVTVPRHDAAHTAYYAVARRPADPTLAGVAMVASVDDGLLSDARVGLVGLGDRPLAGVGTARALTGQPLATAAAAGSAALAAEIAPLPSPAGDADYRRSVAPAALERALRQLTRNG